MAEGGVSRKSLVASISYTVRGYGDGYSVDEEECRAVCWISA